MRGTSPNPIGIDVGARALKAVQFDAAGRMLASVVLPRLDTEPGTERQELARLAQVMGRQGFVGVRCVSACPWRRVMTEPLRLPPAESGAPRHELAAAELVNTRQLEPGTFEVGLWPIPTPARGGDGSFVMATAAAHADTELLYWAFCGAGLDLLAIDAPAVALARAMAAGCGDAGGLVLLIDLGWTAARVTALLGGTIVFERSNDDAGLRHLHQQVIDALGVEPEAADLLLRRGQAEPADEESDDTAAWRAALGEVAALAAGHFEAAAREIGAAVQYVGHRYPDAAVSGASVVGGGAAVPGAIDLIVRELGTESMDVGPAALGLLGAAAGDAAALALAVGLATHGVGRKGVAA